MKNASKAPLNHLFNIHDFGNSTWSMAKKKKQGLKYISKDGPFLDKEKDSKTYLQIKEICDRFNFSKAFILVTLRKMNALIKCCCTLPQKISTIHIQIAFLSDLYYAYAFIMKDFFPHGMKFIIRWDASLNPSWKIIC